MVLGFPCNQFGAQEPGTSDEIASFCSRTYDVTFPIFAKVDVNGANEHPLFAYLKQERRGALGTKSIKWNFTKFLVGRGRRSAEAIRVRHHTRRHRRRRSSCTRGIRELGR